MKTTWGSGGIIQQMKPSCNVRKINLFVDSTVPWVVTHNQRNSQWMVLGIYFKKKLKLKEFKFYAELEDSPPQLSLF